MLAGERRKGERLRLSSAERRWAITVVIRNPVFIKKYKNKLYSNLFYNIFIHKTQGTMFSNIYNRFKDFLK